MDVKSILVIRNFLIPLKLFLNPIPTGHGRNQLIYERHVTKSGRDRVKGPGTSKLDWMYFELGNTIKLIRMNSRFAKI